jgi:hypothetical protein
MLGLDLKLASGGPRRIDAMRHITLLSVISAAAALSYAQSTTQSLAPKQTPAGSVPPARSAPPASSTRPAVERSAAQVLRIGLGQVRLERAPLQQALEWLAQTADVNVFVNWDRLAAIGVRPEMPVSVMGQGLTVGEYLDLLISDVNRGKPRLGYEVGRDMIHIATRQDLDQELVTRVYPVYDLLRSYRGRPAQLFIGRVQDYVLSIDPVVAPGVAVPRPIIGRAADGVFLGATEPGARYDETSEQETQRLAAELIAAITGSVEPDSWEANGGRGTISFFEGMLIVRNSNRVQRILGGTLTSGAP